MTFEQTLRHLDTLTLADALWWFVENINPDHEHRGRLFFYLRERVRKFKRRWNHMNNQQFFDVTMAHLHKQGKAASNGADKGGRCCYRMPDPANPGVTLSCAVGCHMTDYMYDPSFESLTVGAVLGIAHEEVSPRALKAQLLQAKLACVTPGLMREMQSLHDSELALHGLGSAQFRREAADIARKYGLEFEGGTV